MRGSLLATLTHQAEAGEADAWAPERGCTQVGHGQQLLSFRSLSTDQGGLQNHLKEGKLDPSVINVVKWKDTTVS